MDNRLRISFPKGDHSATQPCTLKQQQQTHLCSLKESSYKPTYTFTCKKI